MKTEIIKKYNAKMDTELILHLKDGYKKTKKKINLEAIVEKKIDIRNMNVNLMKITLTNHGMKHVKVKKNVN